MDALIGAIISSGILLAALNLSDSQRKTITASRLISTRDLLRNQADRMSMDRDLITESAKYTAHEANIALQYCLNGKTLEGTTTPTPKPASCASHGDDCCVHSTPTMPQPFFLLDPSDRNAVINSRTIFSGVDALPTAPMAPVATAAPARFAVDGKRCLTASENCPLELVTTFIATCPALALRCDKAESIQVRYILRYANGIQLNGKTPAPPFESPWFTPETFNSSQLGARKSGSISGGTDELGPPEVARILAQRVTFENNGEFTVPPDISVIYVSIIGAGGGGCAGYTSEDGRSTPGAGGCARVKARVAVSPGEKYAVVIGNGGAGGKGNGSGGDRGGETTFGYAGQPPLIVAGGGQGGVSFFRSNKNYNYYIPYYVAQGGACPLQDALFSASKNKITGMATIPGNGVRKREGGGQAPLGPYMGKPYGEGGVAGKVIIRDDNVFEPGGDGHPGFAIIEY